MNESFTNIAIAVLEKEREAAMADLRAARNREEAATARFDELTDAIEVLRDRMSPPTISQGTISGQVELVDGRLTPVIERKVPTPSDVKAGEAPSGSYEATHG
jgi:hypothetical protein